ncbi:MAG: J domain-containing protein [Alphaproteobacteria bacterium]
MTTAEIEAQIRHDTTWRRPRWDFKNKQRTINPKLVDEFGFFDFADNPEEEAEAKARFQEKTATDDVWDTAALKALKVLGLKPPVTRDFLKQHYKALVKRHHPDANGGDREAEEQLKAINQAYGFLRSRQFA